MFTSRGRGQNCTPAHNLGARQSGILRLRVHPVTDRREQLIVEPRNGANFRAADLVDPRIAGPDRQGLFPNELRRAPGAQLLRLGRDRRGQQ